MRLNITSLAFLVVLLVGANAVVNLKNCTYTLTSFYNISAAVAAKCLVINITALTVPAGQTMQVKPNAGTTVNLNGNITFESGISWAGPMFRIDGTNITFNGNGYTLNGNGQDYWDGLGGNGGMTKPKFIKVTATGSISNLYVLNPPVQTFSVSNTGPMIISGVTVDVTAGDLPNNISGTLPAAHNSDGFDLTASVNLTITNCTVLNQDDCLAVNDAKNLTFTNNLCVGGHGISIGSIKNNNVVQTVLIANNTVKQSTNGLRIKTYVNNTNASVSDVTYSGNTATEISDYGVIIQQDYTNSGATGIPSNTINITNVNFVGDYTNIIVDSTAKPVYVLCGDGSCLGQWDWSMLNVTGGSGGSITNANITGYTLY